MEMNVARRDQRHARLMRQRRELIEPLLIVAAMVQFGEEIAAAGEDVAVCVKRKGEGRQGATAEDGEAECDVEDTSSTGLLATAYSPFPPSPSSHLRRSPHTPAIRPSLCAAISSSVRRHAPFSARRRPRVISRARRP